MFMKELAIKAATEAGLVLKENFGKITHEHIDLKQKFDFVTFVDKQAEEKIVKIIKTAYPDHKIFGEETSKDEVGGYRWIIDPLDGTTNYIHGYPVFSISIGLEWEGDIILGVVYDPSHEELFVAEKGKGAQLNGHPIRVSNITDLTMSLLSTGFPFRAKRKIDLYLSSFKELFTKVSGIRRMGSAAIDLCNIACGRAEGFWEIGLSPWDVAAGYLMIKESGGQITDFIGEDNAIWSGNVIASNGHIHQTLVNVVGGILGDS